MPIQASSSVRVYFFSLLFLAFWSCRMASQEMDVVVAASASSSSSAPIPRKKYDVFISFRGEDTRNNFVSHLHEALKRNKIDTYIDDGIDKGDDVWAALVEAIEESILFLIVFSENYAFSTWCLNELTKILECTQHQDHLVLPIFYKTDPSHVRKQTGTYQLAFKKHENSNQKQHVPKWRAALTRAANLSGWPCGAERNEAELVRGIVKCVSMKLDSKYTSESSGLVSVQQRIAGLESLLFHASEDVRIIGIWGMGGIGKTTLAGEVFHKWRFEYEGSCFLANVREESHRYGITHMRHKLLSALLDDGDPHGCMPHVETSFAMRRLSRKKVLIVLDDVDNAWQIEKLAGSHSWFGRGSRIIITTRDKQVIKDADYIYEVQALRFNEAIQLFYLNAFKNNSIDPVFEDLSERVVDYTKGNPLAIKVLASHLCGKGKREWESQLEKLQKIPDKEIQQALRVSFSGLDRVEQNLLLDIACFFIGRRVKDIKSVLDAAGYSTIIGLERLQDKALLTISNGYVEMHSLIQDMGREIVREEPNEDPEKCSRLWDYNDIYQVLRDNLGTEAVRGLTLNRSQIIGDLHLSPQVFGRMRKLKFLEIYSSDHEQRKVLHFPGGLQSLPNQLRYLHWEGYPLKSLPSTFSAENLVSLQLENSQLRHLWHGTK
ncbi:disease resistance protein RPV1-like [Prosopis cineraria]|uniref:disease resistance protein RPV1-like n=1 Tax=Prosopis cineraria TaxID=364024 RepID=UPI00240EFA33|nr:disease resistance protein RPV1-like [Prosopis cineraria]